MPVTDADVRSCSRLVLTNAVEGEDDRLNRGHYEAHVGDFGHRLGPSSGAF